LGIPCVVFSSFCFLRGEDFKEVIQLSVQVIFAVVGAGVVEICSVSNVDFAECCMGEVNAAAFDYGSSRPQKGET
jgi:hypothetical protein